MAIPRKRLRTIGADIEKIIKPILSGRGFSTTAIVNSWVDVVGVVLAKHTLPEKISFPLGSRLDGTLHLRVNSSAVALELQHLAPQLKDKINTYFGYRAINHLKIVQGPIPEISVHEEKQNRSLNSVETEKLEQTLNVISDPELKSALSNLGSSVIQSN